MCVFLSLRADKANLQKRFNAVFIEEDQFGPKYVQSAFEFPQWPVIASDNPGEIRMMRWGLIPSWIRDRDSAMKFRINTVNARLETIHEKPAFRQAATERHCLVLADGFYEFRELQGKKFPYFIRIRDGRLFALAGLYEHWADRLTGEIIPTFSILTTQANPFMEVIHNRKKRMPVILTEKDEPVWLSPGSAGSLKPFPEGQMEAWPVSGLITSRNPERNSPEVQKKVDYPELSEPETQQSILY
jgi:putative SOS response-associated peptidase YedK